MTGNDAMYHLNKIIGYEVEEQKHIDALKSMGIDVLLAGGAFIVLGKGIERFEQQVTNRGTVKAFCYRGVDVIEKV